MSSGRMRQHRAASCCVKGTPKPARGDTGSFDSVYMSADGSFKRIVTGPRAVGTLFRSWYDVYAQAWLSLWWGLAFRWCYVARGLKLD